MNILFTSVSTIALSLVFASNAYAQKPAQEDRKRPPKPCFSSIDSNSDGNIDFEEFSAHKIPFGEHEKVFAKIDTDGDGMISNVEFTSHKPPRHKKKVAKRFALDD